MSMVASGFCASLIATFLTFCCPAILQIEADGEKKTSQSYEPPNMILTDVSSEEGPDEDLFTSKNQGTTWVDKGISPTSLVDIAEAQTRIDRDKKFENANREQQRCILFLYGIEYAWTLDKVDRIKAIQEMTNSENIHRLREIAFSDPSDTLMRDPIVVQLFVNMVLTLKYISNSEGSKLMGGFPCSPFTRYQGSKNCFLPATVVFLSLSTQFHNKNVDEESEKTLQVLDVAQSARRWLVEDHSVLKKRVLNDKGKSAKDFLEELVGQTTSWRTAKFSDSKDLFHEAGHVRGYYAQCGPGLVVGFRIFQHFLNAAKANTEKTEPGYWKFEGNSCDCEGEFVELVSTDMKADQNIKKQLNDALEKERQAIKECKEAHKTKLSNSMGEPSTPTPRKQHKNAEVREASGAIHAMVLLAVIKRENARDDLYVLLNSWKQLPLVVVSPQYMAACGAEIVFTVCELSNNLENPRYNNVSMAECANVDFCDSNEDEISDVFDYRHDDGDY